MFAHENMGKLIKVFAGLLIVALDIVAGILGYKAEAAQNQVHQQTPLIKFICIHFVYYTFVFSSFRKRIFFFVSDNFIILIFNMTCL